MASIILPLAMTGSRKADGTANAGGRVYLSLIDSPNSSVTGYLDRDKNAAATLSGGGYVLDQAGKIALFIDTACRVRTEDTNGAAVDAYVYEPVINEGLVEVDSPGFTGVSPTTGSLAAGGRTTLAAVLSSLYASTGGLDGKFRGVYGTADTNIRAEIESIFLTPQRFGAFGNGVADDTTAIQAMASAASSSGIPIYFPRGTYKISSAITFGAGSVISGAGRTVQGSFINCVNATQDGFIVGSDSIVENLAIGTTGSTGTALKMSSAGNLINVGIGTAGSGSFATAGNNTGGGAIVAIGCLFNGSTTAVAGGTWIVNYAHQFTGAGIAQFNPLVANVSGAGTQALSSQSNTASMATGGNVTPTTIQRGVAHAYQRVVGTSTGSGTINLLGAPPTGTCILVVECVNAAAANFVFTFSGYKSTGTATTTTGLRIAVTFAWNPTDGFWVEIGRTLPTATAGGV